MWGGVHDVINCANFFENRSRGVGAGIPRKTAFPIESVHRPYNSVSTTVLHCDKDLAYIFRTLRGPGEFSELALPLHIHHTEWCLLLQIFHILHMDIVFSYSTLAT